MKMLGFVLVFAVTVLVVSQSPCMAITVVVNDQPLPATPAAVEVNGRVLLPMRMVFEALQATVDWDAQTRTAQAVRGNTTVRMTINSATAFVNAMPVALDVPPQLIQGHTYVPVRFPAEAFGAQVGWTQQTQTVTITLAGLPYQSPSTSHASPRSTTQQHHSEVSSEGRRLVCEMYQSHIAIMHETGCLIQSAEGSGARRLSRDELSDWLSKQDFSRFKGNQKRDLESWKDALQSFLESPGSGFSQGMKAWEPMKKAMAALASFEIDGPTASLIGFPHIAEDVDNLLAIAKVIVLVQAGQDPEALKTVRKPVRCFVEYFYIFNVLAGAKRRIPIAQAAVLSMRPDEVEGVAEQEELSALHQAVLSLSRAHPTGGDALEPNIVQTLYAMLNVMNKLDIADAELRKASGEKLVPLISLLRRLEGECEK